jgi:hypothetical protein
MSSFDGAAISWGTLGRAGFCAGVLPKKQERDGNDEWSEWHHCRWSLTPSGDRVITQYTPKHTQYTPRHTQNISNVPMTSLKPLIL